MYETGMTDGRESDGDWLKWDMIGMRREGESEEWKAGP